MKSILIALGLSLALPAAASATVSVSPIADQTLNAGSTLTLNVVAVDPDGNAITLTSSLPTFATLNTPTSGTGEVVTTVTITPADGDVGSHAASITATANALTDTEDFQITVAASGSNQPPRVTAPALETTAEGSLLSFNVTASDPDDDPITSLNASDMPSGASFTTSDPFTSGAFSWTPDFGEAGEYDVIFSASNALTDSATTHISVAHTDRPVKLDPIADQALTEGDSVQVNVIASDPDKDAITLTSSLPSFATLNAPTTSEDAETLKTTLTIKPGTGTAGVYQAWVKATSLETADTDSFTITVAAASESTLAARATLIGAFNTHRKFLCWKVVPVDSSFSLLDADLSTITLNFHGKSIPATRPTHLAFDCEGEDDQGEDEGGGGQPPTPQPHHQDGASLAATDGGDGEDCEECQDGGETDSTGCTASHIMACFSMSAIFDLFGGGSVPDSLMSATIEGQLKDGRTFAATTDGKVHVPPGQDKGHGHGNDNGDHERGKGKMHLFVKPNPMNPRADIVFTLSQPGRVQVAIFDLRGRLVRTVQNGDLSAGQHSVPWDGSTASGHAASGIYYVKVQTPTEVQVQAVTVLK